MGSTFGPPTLGDRTLFPRLQSKAFLAHAAISPLSAPVIEAMREVEDDFANRGVLAASASTPRLNRVRQALARLIGGSEDDIALIPNTTTGVLNIAYGLPWKKGDRVVLFNDEFPANVTPWQHAAQTFGLELVWLDLEPCLRSAEEWLDQLRRELERGARLVAVSAVQFKSGLRMPVTEMVELCHRHRAELFVDAIQAVGETPVNVGTGIDYLVCGGHKGLMGPEGTGFLYVSRTCAKALEPRLAGWLSAEQSTDFLFSDDPCMRYDKPFKTTAQVFEIGTQNVAGLNGLGASVELLDELGVQSIHAHVNAYLDELEPAVVERGFRSWRTADPSGRSTLLSFTPPTDVRLTKLAGYLREHGVPCNTPDGLLRFSPHWPNHVGEVPVVLQALDAALAESR